MTIVQQSATDRTLLDAVRRIIRRIGESDIATLVQPTKRVSTAINCVQDARDEVWDRTLWDFRRGYFRIDVVAATMWYVLPTDYYKMDSDLSRDTEGLRGLTYISHDQLLAMYPAIRAFPPGAGVTNISTVSQLAAQTTSKDGSLYYTTSNGYLGLYPIPDDDFVEDDPYLYASYWKQAPSLESDNDSLGLPSHLWSIVHYLAAAQLKKALEYPDWEADEAKGRSMLMRASNTKTEQEDMENLYQPRYDYNE